MYVVTVVFKVKAEAKDDFHKLVIQQAKNSLEKEEGCHRFDVCFDDRRPDTVFLYEVYDDSAAFDLHRETEYFKAFREAAEPLLESRALNTWWLLNPA
jgi:quinol monooxygenase YgiN